MHSSCWLPIIGKLFTPITLASKKRLHSRLKNGNGKTRPLKPFIFQTPRIHSVAFPVITGLFIVRLSDRETLGWILRSYRGRTTSTNLAVHLTGRCYRLIIHLAYLNINLLSKRELINIKTPSEISCQALSYQSGVGLF